MRSRLMILPLAASILACGGGGSDSTGPGTTGGTGGRRHRRHRRRRDDRGRHEEPRLHSGGDQSRARARRSPGPTRTAPPTTSPSTAARVAASGDDRRGRRQGARHADGGRDVHLQVHDPRGHDRHRSRCSSASRAVSATSGAYRAQPGAPRSSFAPGLVFAPHVHHDPRTAPHPLLPRRPHRHRAAPALATRQAGASTSATRCSSPRAPSGSSSRSS